MNRLRRWPVAVLTAADRLVNAILLGDDRLTISSRLWDADQKGRAWARWPRRAVDWIALRVFGEADHCQRSDEFDRALAAVTAAQAIARMSV